MTQEIDVTRTKRYLATIWFSGTALIFFIVLIQSILGRYGDQTNQAWGWLLPTVVPTLSLIIGVLVHDTVLGSSPKKTTERYFFYLTAALSSGYLLAVFLVIALQPLETTSPVQSMSQTNIWLGPFQGLVAAAMGAFFVKSAQDNTQGNKTVSSGNNQPSA